MQRYHVKQSSEQLCKLLDLTPEQVSKRAGLPAGLELSERGVTAREYFAYWNAVVAEASRPDLSLYLGQLWAQAPSNSETMAFTLSPDVLTGLGRLAVFKSLVCPLRFAIDESRAGVRLTLHSDDPRHPLRADFHAIHLVFVTALIRRCTGLHLVPLQVGFDGPERDMPEMADFFGRAPQRNPVPTLLLSREDVARPLLSGNDEQWAWLEPPMRARLNDMREGKTLADRVTSVLVELLPAGLCGIDVVCEKLHLSKRSLQRALKEEQTSFQAVLSQTRQELALSYLAMSEISIDEISHLLAYREPNSFYRAFHGWTGTTPLQARLDHRPLEKTAGTP